MYTRIFLSKFKRYDIFNKDPYILRTNLISTTFSSVLTINGFIFIILWLKSFHFFGLGNKQWRLQTSCLGSNLNSSFQSMAMYFISSLKIRYD